MLGWPRILSLRRNERRQTPGGVRAAVYEEVVLVQLAT